MSDRQIKNIQITLSILSVLGGFSIVVVAVVGKLILLPVEWSDTFLFIMAILGTSITGLALQDVNDTIKS